MGRILIALVVAGAAFLGFDQTVRAADGCSYDAYGRLYCQPGARPGTPYGYGGYGYGGYGPRYRSEGRRCHWERERFWDGYSWRSRRIRVCD